MMTNKELFLIRLQNSSTEEFVRLTSLWGKCSRCSNYFWDGNQTHCHKNINESSCEKGYAEWLDARPDEDLQKKYNKRYFYFRDRVSAFLGKGIMDILYTYNAVTPPADYGEKKCLDGCFGGEKGCGNASCYMYWQHILNLYESYIEEQAKARLRSGGIAANQTALEHTTKSMSLNFKLNNFILEILIPQIQDTEMREKAKQILKFKEQYDAEFDKGGRNFTGISTERIEEMLELASIPGKK